MILTPQNYFSHEADKFYLSTSQYNSFIGVPAKPKCEARALAKFKGEWVEEKTTAMLVGSYVDAYFDNDLENFKKDNPAIFTLKGDLRADFILADIIIHSAEKDDFFISYVRGEGQSQVIITGEIGGTAWKGKIDRLHTGIIIVDLKVIASIREKIWCDFEHAKLNFIDAYGYIRQAAVYRELYYQVSGEKLPFYIAAITKEKVADKEVILIPDGAMDMALEEIKLQTQYVVKVKNGELPAVSCGRCDYCRSVKKLEGAIMYEDLV
jgi:hypothetical protein